MFENLKKLNTGRTRVKIIAAMLAIILTFANFTFLGLYVGKTSYAADDSKLTKQDNSINSNNGDLDASQEELKIDEISEDNIELMQEVITNKLYEINGEAKRVVQILIKASVKGNIVPVKQTNIEMNVPEIKMLPEKVKVSAYSTKASNGRTAIEFADLETSSWKYDEVAKKINIEILNPEDENGNISWEKDSQDEIIVTYIYGEDAEVAPFISNAKLTEEVYVEGDTKTVEKVNTLKLEEMKEVENLVTVTNSLSPIYKGNLYINNKEEYIQTYDVYVSYKELANKIQIEDLGDEIEASTYYKKTAINKKQAVSVLGEEGIIEIYDAETKELVQSIDLSEETEGDYIVVEYDKEISKIIIETSKVQKEGKIGIINQKEITTSDKAIAQKLNKLTSNINLLVSDENDKVITNTNSVVEAKIEEPSTKYSISLDKTNLPAGVENSLRITTELNTENSSSKLFENPQIRVELPAEITEAKIENITPVIYSEELKLKSYEIVTNANGNKEVVIKIEGVQKEYPENSAYIAVDLKVKTDSFMASKKSNLKITCINGKDSIETTKDIALVSKNGFVTKNTLNLGTEVLEKINTNSLEEVITENTNIVVNSKLINNFGEALSNVNIVGKVADEVMLTEKVVANIEGAKVYYQEENTQNWVEEISDLSKVKSFKIVIPKEVAKDDIIEISYKALANIENLKANKEIINNLVINYEINSQAKQEKIKFTLYALAKKAMPTVMSVEDSSLMKASLADRVANQVEIKVSPKAMTSTLYQGQIVTYEIAVKNNSEKDLKNPKIVYTVPEGTVLTELTYSQGSEIIYTDKEKIGHRTITFEGTLGAGKTRTAKVTLRIKNDATQIVNNIVAQTAEGDVIGTLVTEPVKVVPGDLNVMLSRADNYEVVLDEKSSIVCIVMIKNNTTSTMRNLQIRSKIPEGTIWLEDAKQNKDWTYNKQTGEIYYKLDLLAAGKTEYIRFKVEVDKIDNENCEDIIDNMVMVKTESGTEYASNVYENKMNKAYWKINMKSKHSETLKEDDSIKYIISVTNIGKKGGVLTLLDEIPEEIDAQRIIYYYDNKEENKKEEAIFNNNINFIEYVNIGETVVIEIEGKVNNLANGVTNKKITNIAKISLEDDKYIESNEITNTIVKNSDENQNNPSKPEEPSKPNNPENPENPEKPTTPEEPVSPGEDRTTFSISGMVWLDKNKNGIKENGEEEIQSQRILLLDEKGEVIKETKSSLTGTYKFTDLSTGKYLVAIVYDKDKYAVTKYQVQTAKESENSDVVAKQIKIGSKSEQVGITDTITIKNKDITNKDMGLIENPVFDLSLNKYISKVVVTTKEETKNYEYEEPTNLAKIEISKKKISGATLLVEYEIEVVNEGDVEGYATDIIDYLPKELTFSSEMNPEWYKGADNNLHYMALEPKAIAPGESQKVKLVLTKNLKNNSVGTIGNIAEIGENTNLEGITEKDSIAGNHKEGEDDISKAELIVSIQTGSQVVYLGIVIISITILGIGIYIIDKKVLKVKF